MTNLGKQKGAVAPKAIEITTSHVYVATNIEPYTETLDGQTVSGYQYDYTQYDKDEYLGLLITNNATNSAKILELEEQLAAAKILLGVE